MNMRDLIDIVDRIISIDDKSLLESIIRAEMRYGVLPVWRNPTRNQAKAAFKKFGLLRGMTDASGDLYTWEAAEATHDDVDEVLGLVDLSHRFMIPRNGSPSVW